MEATEVTTQMTFRCSPLPELEVPMINTMVTCMARSCSRPFMQWLSIRKGCHQSKPPRFG